ncbi:MAG: hypothetical protein AB1522_10945 [Chloroflexota bacterium]
MISLPIVDLPLKTVDRTAPRISVALPEVGRVQELKVPEYNLRAYLNSLLPLPLRTGFLGVDKSESPLLFDLMDPRPGSIVIIGDHDSGKIRLLKTLLYSLVMNNPDYEVKISLISARVSQWKYEYEHFQNYFVHFTNNYDHPAGKALLDVADLVESRQHGRNEGGCHLVIVDGFDTLPYMDFDIRLNFEWLLQEGPFFEVWPVVVMDSRTAAEQKKWLEKFKTRIFGRIRDAVTAAGVSNISQSPLPNLLAGKEFAVKISSREHHFYLPDSI